METNSWPAESNGVVKRRGGISGWRPSAAARRGIGENGEIGVKTSA